MAETSTDLSKLAGTRDESDVGAGDVGFCARPQCRKEFRRDDGPGRPAYYCSDTCRKNAAKERRQLTGRLKHFERQVDQLRIDLAAFTGPPDEDGMEFGQPLRLREDAQKAVHQASGAVQFLRNADDPASQQLCRLYDAVAPLFA
jgi:hypothetical protein